MRNLLILVLLHDGDLRVRLVPSFADHSFGCTRILCVHIFMCLVKQLHHRLEWGFAYGEIEVSKQQSSLERGQYNLVFYLIDLQQLLIKASYILP